MGEEEYLLSAGLCEKRELDFTGDAIGEWD